MFQPSRESTSVGRAGLRQFGQLDDGHGRRISGSLASLVGLEAALERDNFMGAEAAIEYGIIDTVLAQRTELGKKSED